MSPLYVLPGSLRCGLIILRDPVIVPSIFLQLPCVQIKDSVFRLGRDDSCHPLLNAVHRLHVDAVQFLLLQGLSGRQRGTVHPYTGDNMTVSDVKGTHY